MRFGDSRRDVLRILPSLSHSDFEMMYMNSSPICMARILHGIFSAIVTSD